MIERNRKEIVEIIRGTLPLSEVYHGKFLVWQIMKSRSCFGSGYWINDKPWLNDDAWKN
jgi:hypothetical protein